jgi:hypothetical protein
MDEGIFVKSLKSQFVPAEYELLLNWSKVLENEQKGSVLVYLQLQVGVNREEGNVNEGKSWLSIKTISERCAMGRATVWRCLKILEKYKFILKEDRRDEGKSNLYTIFDLPIFKNAIEEEEKKEVKNIKDIEVLYDDKNIFSNGTEILSAQRVKDAAEVISKYDYKSKMVAKDIFSYFKNVYYLQYQLKYRDKLNGKDLKLLKMLNDEYGIDILRNAIKFSIENWGSFDFVNGYPSIAAFFGFRDTLIPLSQKGFLQTKGGQYKKSDESKEIVAW